jgi:RNA polymerase sigma-70 factor (ECF subfamily)
LELKHIISGCKKREPGAQKALVFRYTGILLTVCRRYTRNELDAEDVLQDAYIEIFKSFKNFDANKGTLEGWMKKIVINTALKQFRAQKNWLENGLQVIDNDIPILPSVYEKLQEEELIQLISSLPEGYRQVFNLYAIEGYSHREISSLLGIEEASSRSNLSRARGLLKDKLKQIKKTESWMKIG